MATPEDPSSAGIMNLCTFFISRTIFFSYISAWNIANDDCRKTTTKVYSEIHNEMIQAHFLLLQFTISSEQPPTFHAAAFIGIALLETVNYIPNITGCKENEQGRYENMGACPAQLE